MAMTTVDNIVGLVIAVALNGVPIRGAAVSGEVLMSGTSWLQIRAALTGGAVAHRASAGRLPGQDLRRRGQSPAIGVFGPIERVIYQYAESILAASTVEHLCSVRACVQRCVLPAAVWDRAVSGRAAVQSDGQAGGD